MKNTIEINRPRAGFFAAVKALMLVLFFTFSGMSMNTVMAAEKAMTKEQTEARISAIKERVAEIQATNVKTLSKAERKDLRTELKEMNKELKQMHPTYVYISGGGLLLIIILLIIFL